MKAPRSLEFSGWSAGPFQCQRGSLEQPIECAFLELQPPANLLADAVDCFRVEVVCLVRRNPAQVHRSTDAG